jgi:hypothetical protein
VIRAAAIGPSLALALLLAMPAVAAPPTIELRTPDEVNLVAGAAGAVSLTVVPPQGRTISADGPVRIALSGDGLTLPRRRYARRDAADPAAEAPRFDLRVRGAAAGDHALRIEVRLWLCGARLCRPVHAARTVRVRVAPA